MTTQQFGVQKTGSICKRKITHKHALACLCGYSCARIKHHTWIRKDDGIISIQLYKSVIIVIHSNNTYTLYTRGKKTKLTKSRLNELSPARIYQHKKQWYIGNGVPFREGITINAKGQPCRKQPYLIEESDKICPGSGLPLSAECFG